MASRNGAETRSKQLTAISYVVLHTLFLLGACGAIPAIPLAFQIPADLSVPSQCAMLAPVISLGIFAYLHGVDRKRRKAHLTGATDQRIGDWNPEPTPREPIPETTPAHPFPDSPFTQPSQPASSGLSEVLERRAG